MTEIQRVHRQLEGERARGGHLDFLVLVSLAPGGHTLAKCDWLSFSFSLGLPISTKESLQVITRDAWLLFIFSGM